MCVGFFGIRLDMLHSMYMYVFFSNIFYKKNKETLVVLNLEVFSYIIEISCTKKLVTPIFKGHKPCQYYFICIILKFES